jgi:hypothetical protein
MLAESFIFGALGTKGRKHTRGHVIVNVNKQTQTHTRSPRLTQQNYNKLVVNKRVGAGGGGGLGAETFKFFIYILKEMIHHSVRVFSHLLCEIKMVFLTLTLLLLPATT